MIWAVYNGWMGETAVAALVEAETEATARARGILVLREHEEARAAKATADFENRYASNPRYTGPARRDMARTLEIKPRPSYWGIEDVEQVPIPCVAGFGGVE